MATVTILDVITIRQVAGVMSRTQPTLHKSAAAGAFRRRHLGLKLWVFLLAGAIRATPVAAQVPEAGPQNAPTTGNESAPSITGGGAGITPAFPGAAPEVLPPPPLGGFGLPNPTAPPYSVNNQIPTLTSPPSLSLQPSVGVVPLQAYDPTAPAVLIIPRASLAEIFTDNVNWVPSPRKFAAISELSAGASISADTPRLQAVVTGAANGQLYLPGSNSSFNQVFGTLYGNGHATVYPEALFVDFQSSITQSTTLPGFGFQNLSTLPNNQQTQQFITNVSPYLIKSFDGLVDTELRYSFGYTSYGGNTTVLTAPAVPGLSSLASSTLNEGTFIAATGENFQKLLARFTADASEYSTSSATQNTQLSAFNDFQYNFTPTIAALGRVGYQNLSYPSSPAANFSGATWLAGGRLGTAGPDQPAYVALEYGRQQGVYGFTGSAQVNVTPTMLLSASLVQGVSSQGQFFSGSLATSTLTPSGAIVNQSSGLPTAFYSPGLGLSNNVFRQHLFNVGLTDAIGPNRYSLYGSYSEYQSLTTTTSPPTKSLGVNLGYSRDIRPDLSGYAYVGYVNSVNSPATTIAPSTTSFNTASASLSLNYILGRTLTGSIVYNFSYQSTGTVLIAGHTGEVFVNQLELLLSKTF